ncbi:MAG: ribosome silencing factor [Syntrophobacteraceae bacterium]|nr:ribosome silencing factor [Syntrophobacteraceae bacterium]
MSELMSSPQSMSARERALLLAKLAVDFKALDLMVLDVTGLSSFADFFVICSGQSSRQVQGIADNIQRSLRERGIRALGVEGHREGQWVLMDYGDVIVHVFYEPVRLLYDLESLWSEARRVRLDHAAVPESTVVP